MYDLLRRPSDEILNELRRIAVLKHFEFNGAREAYRDAAKQALWHDMWTKGLKVGAVIDICYSNATIRAVVDSFGNSAETWEGVMRVRHQSADKKRFLKSVFHVPHSQLQLCRLAKESA